MNEIAKQFDAAIRYARVDPESLQAFHRSLVDNPNDARPHLVFADYLQEHGHDTAAHLIRRAFDPDTNGSAVSATEVPRFDPASPPRTGLIVGRPKDGKRRTSLTISTSHDTDPTLRRWITYISHLSDAELTEVLPAILPRYDGSNRAFVSPDVLSSAASESQHASLDPR